MSTLRRVGASLVATLVALLALTGCGDSVERGVPSRPLAPRTITVRMMSHEQQREFEHRGIEASATVAGEVCVIFVPTPTGYRDFETWLKWFHELRHCDGQQHDENDVWLEPAPRTEPHG